MSELTQIIQGAPRWAYLVCIDEAEIEAAKRIANSLGKDIYFITVKTYQDIENTAKVVFIKTPSVADLNLPAKHFARAYPSPAPYYKEWLK